MLSAFVTVLFLAYRLFYEGRAVGAPKKKEVLREPFAKKSV